MHYDIAFIKQFINKQLILSNLCFRLTSQFVYFFTHKKNSSERTHQAMQYVTNSRTATEISLPLLTAFCCHLALALQFFPFVIAYSSLPTNLHNSSPHSASTLPKEWISIQESTQIMYMSKSTETLKKLIQQKYKYSLSVLLE